MRFCPHPFSSKLSQMLSSFCRIGFERILRRCARGGSIHYLHCFSLDRTFGSGSCRLTRWANLQKWCRFQDPKNSILIWYHATRLKDSLLHRNIFFSGRPLVFFCCFSSIWHPWNLGPTDRGRAAEYLIYVNVSTTSMTPSPYLIGSAPPGRGGTGGVTTLGWP